MGHEFPNPPAMERAAHELPLLAEKGAYWKDRVKATGNAVVPQVVYPIFAALYERLAGEL